MATHYMKAEGGFHQRIWFAKAGRGTHQDIGISPMADQHLANGSYSFSLAAFDPRNLDVKEAAVEGKATSLYQGMGAQFGGQIWRMAHEAKVGDYIFLESENHNLHAVGVRLLGDSEESSLLFLSSPYTGVRAIAARRQRIFFIGSSKLLDSVRQGTGLRIDRWASVLEK